MHHVISKPCFISFIHHVREDDVPVVIISQMRANWINHIILTSGKVIVSQNVSHSCI